MITNLALSKTNRLSLILVGMLAIGAGGIAGLAATNAPLLYIFAALGGILLVVGMTIQPEWGLLFLTFLIYSNLSDVLIEHGAPSITKPFLVLLLAIILIRWLLYNEQPKGWEHITLFIIAYGLIYLTSFLYAANTSGIVRMVVDMVKDGIIAIVVTILLQRAASLRRVVWVLLAVGIFIGTINVYQQLTGTFTNNYWGFAQATLSHITGETQDYRLGGHLGQANSFAQFMVVLVPLALDRLWSEQKRPLRLVAAWAVGVLILSIFFTFSRGAFISLVLILAVTFVLRPPRPLAILSTILIAAFLLQFLPARYTERMETLLFFLPGSEKQAQEEDISFRNRTSQNLSAWEMFKDHPFLGVGTDNFSSSYIEYARPLGIDHKIKRNAEPMNLYLGFASELGLVGLAWFGMLTWFVFRSLRQARKDFIAAGMPNYAGLILALGLGIGSLYITGISVNLNYERFFWLLWAIALATPHVAKRELAASYLKNNPNYSGYVILREVQAKNLHIGSQIGRMEILRPMAHSASLRAGSQNDYGRVNSYK